MAPLDARSARYCVISGRRFVGTLFQWLSVFPRSLAACFSSCSAPLGSCNEASVSLRSPSRARARSPGKAVPASLYGARSAQRGRFSIFIITRARQRREHGVIRCARLDLCARVALFPDFPSRALIRPRGVFA